MIKYKYPKSIVIGNHKFKITYDYNSWHSNFSYPNEGEKAFICFGMAIHEEEPMQFLCSIIHELKEIIQIEQSTRLWRRGTDSYVFVYDHSDHADLCARLAGLIVNFIK